MLRDLFSSTDFTLKRRVRVASTVECFVVVVIRCLRSDRFSIEHAAMVVARLESVAGPNRRETFGWIRFERKPNLKGSQLLSHPGARGVSIAGQTTTGHMHEHVRVSHSRRKVEWTVRARFRRMLHINQAVGSRYFALQEEQDTNIAYLVPVVLDVLAYEEIGKMPDTFTTTCEQEVQNNLTYVISPGFPNLIDWPMNCSVVVQKIDRQVSQLRIDFVHFNIGQPNPRTGVCDEDIMEIRNGRSVFQMCGWNSGQHLYIDLDEDDQSLTLDFRLPSNLRSRMWEMRVVQLDFEQRAPTGCLQYFQGSNGTLKTFNFLSNGRFLADQDYLMCIRQEREMCGISYTPCSPDSFRIGPPRMLLTNNTNLNGSSMDEGPNANSTTRNTTVGSTNGTDIEGSGSNPMEEGGTSMNMSNTMEQEVGSSNGAVYGQERCRDRVLIPCDFEEFITPGNNEAGICNLEHCGNSLCDRNELDEEGNCRVETWATPFRIRVAFGPGQDTGTTLEDNIGMCLVYEQLPCVV